MALTGMDVQAVRQLASLMTQKASEIEGILGSLSSSLTSAPWVGNDRERFIGEWQGTHVPQLKAVCQMLHDASTAANKNAAEQETASA
jgi:uncharacterized protein YukE